MYVFYVYVQRMLAGCPYFFMHRFFFFCIFLWIIIAWG